MSKLTDNEIMKALECCTNPKVGEKCPRKKFIDLCNDGCVHLLMKQALDLINSQKAVNDDLFLKLSGVMHSVDKWLEGDELNQDEVNRAIAMREKTLKIIEDKQSEADRFKEGMYFERERVDNIPNLLLRARSDAIKEFAERLKEMPSVMNCEYEWLHIDIDNLVKEMEKLQ